MGMARAAGPRGLVGQIDHIAVIPWKRGTIRLYRGGYVYRLAGSLTVDAAKRHATPHRRIPDSW